MSPLLGSWFSLRVSRSDWLSVQLLSSPPSPSPTLHYPSLGSDSSFDTAALSQVLSVTVVWHWVFIVEDMKGKQRSCVASDFRELEAFQAPAGELFPECFFLQVAASPHSVQPVGVPECLVGAGVFPCTWCPNPNSLPLLSSQIKPRTFMSFPCH